jgi:hypothetical protein
MERPPPARAQASIWKAQANRNNRAKRVKIPFVQVFNFINFLRDNFGLESIAQYTYNYIVLMPANHNNFSAPDGCHACPGALCRKTG